jgi:hypothetical protein
VSVSPREKFVLSPMQICGGARSSVESGQILENILFEKMVISCVLIR